MDYTRSFRKSDRVSCLSEGGTHFETKKIAVALKLEFTHLADLGPDPLTGKTISAKQRMDEIIKAAQLC